jgi:hypothetical protein
MFPIYKWLSLSVRKIHLGELIQDITFTRNGFFGLNGGGGHQNPGASLSTETLELQAKKKGKEILQMSS